MLRYCNTGLLSPKQLSSEACLQKHSTSLLPPKNSYPICKNTACKVFPVFLKLLQFLAQTKFPPHTMGLLLDGSQAADPGHDRRHHSHLSPFAHQEARMRGLLPMPPYLSFLARLLHWKITAEILQPKSSISVMIFKNNTRLPPWHEYQVCIYPRSCPWTWLTIQRCKDTHANLDTV